MVDEVLELTPDQFAEWLAYFQLKAKESERAHKRAEAKARVGKKRR